MNNDTTKGRRHIPPARTSLALGLALVLAGMPAALAAAERRGADIQVTLISPGLISGELIGINSEKIVVRVGDYERTVALADVDSVRVFRESLKAAGIVVGLVAGGFIGYAVGKTKIPVTKSTKWPFAGLGAILGGGAGLGIAALLSHDKVYEFRGATPGKVSTAVEALSRKARVPAFK